MLEGIRRRLRLEEAGRWVFYGLVIGVVSGLGAAAFFWLLETGKHLFLCELAGFDFPAPYGERWFAGEACGAFNRTAFFLLPALGGLISGLLVYGLAPEAEGHGTDAMIEAFHSRRGIIRGRVPLVKTVATAFVLATGGSAGREGPTIQIGAGFGSFLAQRLGLTARERRIMLIAGAGGGLGAIFRAPLGGALTAMEVLYKEDLETEALIPTVISSITAYIIFSAIYGHGRIFYLPPHAFTGAKELPLYALLGLICVPLGALYVKVFYGLRDRFFRPLPFPAHLKPALGGLLLGALGWLFPQVYGDGWGWIQQAIYGHLDLHLVCLLIPAKMLATSFTVASGGSGGVFGPTLFIGGMIGAMVGFTAHRLLPEVAVEPSAYVVVGMSGFFAGVANAPIGSLLMCSEMTGGYGLITPLLLVSIIALVLTRRWSIYEKQVWNRFHSPAHLPDVTVNILEDIPVAAAAKPLRVRPIYRGLKFDAIEQLFTETDAECLPVADEGGNLVGMITFEMLKPIAFETGFEPLLVAEDIMTRPVTIDPTRSLYEALVMMLDGNTRYVLVVDRDHPNRVLGLLRLRDIVEAYNVEVDRRKRE